MRNLELVIMMIILSQWVFIVPVLQGNLSQIQIGYAQQPQQPKSTESNSCITYDAIENVIRISCKNTDLTDIDNQLQDPELLHKETTNGVWYNSDMEEQIILRDNKIIS